MKKLLSTGEAARRIGVSRERVHYLIQEGRLSVVATVGFGRRLLDAEEVKRFVRERGVSRGQRR